MPQRAPHTLSPIIAALCEGLWARTLMTVRCLHPVDAPGVYESRSEGAVPVLDVEVARVVINPSDGAQKPVYGLTQPMGSVQ